MMECKLTITKKCSEGIWENTEDCKEAKHCIFSSIKPLKTYEQGKLETLEKIMLELITDDFTKGHTEGWEDCRRTIKEIVIKMHQEVKE